MRAPAAGVSVWQMEAVRGSEIFCRAAKRREGPVLGSGSVRSLSDGEEHGLQEGLSTCNEARSHKSVGSRVTSAATRRLLRDVASRVGYVAGSCSQEQNKDNKHYINHSATFWCFSGAFYVPLLLLSLKSSTRLRRLLQLGRPGWNSYS